MTTKTPFDTAFEALPLVAILRGVQPEEIEPIAAALYGAGFRLIEVPMNSPRPLESIARLAKCLPADALCGAGTVLSVEVVHQVKAAGGQIIVMPHSDTEVIKAAKAEGMYCVPGSSTLTEAFAAVHAGADAVKLFPAELITPAIIKAMRAVLPPTLRLLPVGGVTPDNMGDYVKVGCKGFGLGSALYSPGLTAAEVGERAKRFVAGWKAL
jgi:2-dehydro-3-deoxyphosphogalactonate aldolase